MQITAALFAPAPEQPTSQDLRVRVPSRSHPGRTHLVSRWAGLWACTCPGFTHRGRCAHVTAAMELESAGELEALLARRAAS